MASDGPGINVKSATSGEANNDTDGLALVEILLT
jgi:hypothetical protein